MLPANQLGCNVRALLCNLSTTTSLLIMNVRRSAEDNHRYHGTSPLGFLSPLVSECAIIWRGFDLAQRHQTQLDSQRFCVQAPTRIATPRPIMYQRPRWLRGRLRLASHHSKRLKSHHNTWYSKKYAFVRTGKRLMLHYDEIAAGKAQWMVPNQTQLLLGFRATA